MNVVTQYQKNQKNQKIIHQITSNEPYQRNQKTWIMHNTNNICHRFYQREVTVKLHWAMKPRETYIDLFRWTTDILDSD